METEQTPSVEANELPAVPPPGGESEKKPGMMDKLNAWHAANPRRTWLLVGSVLLFFIGFWLKPIPVPHVSLAPQPIFPDGPWWLTNTVVTLFIVDIIIIVMALGVRAGMKLVPGHGQSVIESLLGYLDGLAQGIAGRDARRYYPIAVTIFLLVIVSNWIGLIPGVGSIGFKLPEAEHQEEQNTEGQGAVLDRQLALADGSLLLIEPEAQSAQEEPAEGEEETEHHLSIIPLFRAPSTDLNLTFALAITVMVLVQVWGVRALGGSYFSMFFTFKGQGFMRFINAFVGILELIAQFARVIAFGFRLFGNIFAGEVVLATMTFLIPLWLPVPFYGLELFVGFVQALVFTMLTLVFFSISTVSHEHEHEEGH